MTTPTDAVHAELQRVVRLVRTRYRLRVALRGAVLLAAGTLAVLIAAAMVLEQLRFDATAVTVVRVLVYVAVAALGVWLLAVPLARPISDERVALYIEEHEPSLEAAIVSAVQHAGGAGGSPALIRRLVASAVERVRAVDKGRRIDRIRLRRYPVVLAGVVLAGAAVTLGGPAFLRHAAMVLVTPWSRAAAATPYAIAVEPGNAVIARGGDQRIAARLAGFASTDVRLMVQRGDTAAWDAIPMSGGATPEEFTFELFGLEQTTAYFVEANGVRSPTFRLDVRDLPYAKRLDLEYRFPAYTGLDPRTEEDGGDITALRGTTVRVRVTPTMPVTAGRIVLEGGEAVALAPSDSGSLVGDVAVSKDGFYRIELQAADGTMVTGSLDYVIELLPDHPPTIEIAKPGRDTRVTSIEEVFTELRAEDDYGVAAVELVYAVNGGPEQTVRVASGARGRTELSAGHTLYLEEFDLQPGDIVAYYGRAADGNPYGPGRATTDIYFMQIRPFGRDYRAAESNGGGGEPGDSPQGFSQQQREIVSATFKAQRDRAATSAAEYRENLATITLAQGQLRQRVEAMVRRFEERGILAADSSLRRVAEELPKAAAAMVEAEGGLGRRNPEAALPPEQRALQHLQRAEAAFRDVQVTRENGGGGGGGASNQNAEELADLFELETDRLRNQYEEVQRGREEARQQEVDEVAERLRQLAARQQQENERARRQAEAQAQPGSNGGGGGEGQRRLAQEAEELARRLERLSREQRSAEMRQTARELQEAAEAMRRSAASGSDRGSAQGRAAAERLEAARRRLDAGRSSELADDAREAAERAERLSDEQRGIAEEAGRLARGDDAGRQRIAQRKDRLSGEVNQLEGELDRLSREAGREHRQAARRMQDAANTLRDRRVRDRIEYSKGLLGGGASDATRNFEETISDALDKVRDDAAAGAGGIGEPDGRRGERALEEARNLTRGLESLSDRMQQQGAGAGPGQQPGQPGGQQGAGRDGEAQPGQGQSGQQRGSGQQGGQQAGPQQGGQPNGQGMPGTARQLARELQERRRDAEALRRDLAAQGVDVSGLDRAIAQLRTMESAPGGRDTETGQRLLASVVEALKAFEFSARRELQGEGGERPRLGRADEVPAGYRELVEKYFESLAQ